MSTKHIDAALNYDPTDPDKMRLPAGTTCGDCAHIRRCKAIFGHVETDTYCDWSPSRFRAELAKFPGNATRERPRIMTRDEKLAVAAALVCSVGKISFDFGGSSRSTDQYKPNTRPRRRKQSPAERLMEKARNQRTRGEG